ncbi:hypothetical protein LTR37_008473 [Vermiconidia calcicola]|uniref:Uncharacterized protein n=1 Tax=Vermiconidia calcicola TaxID=1690605 RepID=A0ACC3NAL8_9PEZI|nr:hypothetical protein LTR37_008473 [Vermiconidia calcicola]
MRYTSVLALLSAPLLALAQQANPFNIPPEGIAAEGGEPLTLEWEPTTSGTVSLILRSGASNNLNEGTMIASSISNSGSFTWTPSNELTRGSDYAIQIIDDSDPAQSNYTPYFVLDTDNTLPQTTPLETKGASSTVISKQTDAEVPTTLTSVATTAATSATSSSSDDDEADTVTTVATTDAVTTTTVSTASETASASASASSDNGDLQVTGGSSSAPAAATGAAPRATAMAGMLGLVAMGALAL